MDIQTKELANGIKYLSCDYLSYGDYDNSCAVERANVRYLKELDELKESIESWAMSNWENDEYLSNERDSSGFAKWLPIEANSKLVECYGGYGSIQLWVRSDVWEELELDLMESYHVLNEELVSIIEMEMENEAWESWVKNDLIKTLPDEFSQEQLDNQECRCQNCNWEGIQSELILDDIVYDYMCPDCNSPYAIMLYPIVKMTLQEFANGLDNDVLWEVYRNCCEEKNEYGCVESGGNWYIKIDNLKDCFKEAIEEMYNN